MSKMNDYYCRCRSDLVVLGYAMILVSSLFLWLPAEVKAQLPAPYDQYVVTRIDNNRATKDNFGQAVALSSDGKTLAVGRPMSFHNPPYTLPEHIGGVLVYTQDEASMTWTQQGSALVALGYVGTEVEQGRTVAISGDGNIIASGAPGDDYGEGSIFMFRRQDDVWSQWGNKLTISRGNISSSVGYGVALSKDGSTLVMTCADRGGVAMFGPSGSNWVQLGSTVFTQGANTEIYSVEADVIDDGSRVAVASSQLGSPTVLMVLIRNGQDWDKLGPYELAAKYISGILVSGDGSKILVGTPTLGIFDPSTELSTFWSFNGTEYVLKQELTPPVGRVAFIYKAMAMDANATRLILGDIGVNSVGSTTVGGAFVYTFNGSYWNQVPGNISLLGSTLYTNTITTSSTEFGCAIAMSDDGTTAVFGGYGDNAHAGAVWIYQATPASGPTHGPAFRPSSMPQESAGMIIGMLATWLASLLLGIAVTLLSLWAKWFQQNFSFNRIIL